MNRPLFVCQRCRLQLKKFGRSTVVTRGFGTVGLREISFFEQNVKRRSITSLSKTFFHSNRTWLSDSEQAAVVREPKPIEPSAIKFQVKHPIDPPEEVTVGGITYKKTPPLTVSFLLKTYASLSKARLTTLILLTAMSGYALSPFPGTVSVLLSTAVGTALCSASANALNQVQEIPYDAQMTRTRGRPLVRRVISPLHAVGFAGVTGTLGTGLLWYMVNPLTACLGAANVALYAGLYTHLKRKSPINTWVGAVVGGIPPLMGWTACGGSLIPSTASPIILFLPNFDPSTVLPGIIDNPLAPWTLFLLLFSWQFPHFNPLSLMMASSYARAGFHMLSVTNPRKNAAVAFRHSLFLLPICSILTPLSGLTTWYFALTSLVPNAIAIRAAWRFWRTNGGLDEKMAKSVWRISLWWLPVVLGLMMVHKKDAPWHEWFEWRPRQNIDTETSHQ